MVHDLVITRAHFQCGGLLAATEITFTTDDGGDLVWKGFIGPNDDPVAVRVPGEGQLFIEHCQMSSVSIAHKEYLMRTSRHTFEVVKLTNKTTAPCGKCGKKCTRTKEFMQTVNPFNTNADGVPKTRSEIQTELAVQAKAYRDRNETIYHVKCEG